MKQWEDLPIFKKAVEIEKLVEHIVESVEKTDFEFKSKYGSEMIKHNLEYLKQNAMTIPAKIAGASSEDMLYDIRMENAAIIRKAARELITDVRGIQMHGFKDVEYLDLLREEVESFRILFAEWVKTFDCWNYIIDRWGLFNPPGINYDDVDPDDDIPFNLDDFEED
ncbi:hypothetical protein [Mariniflexile sp.]|uniref:hypothetical protein n=1 Tax=Mariniflexile sp. TaxID=1979402 RepID=UPI00404738EB